MILRLRNNTYLWRAGRGHEHYERGTTLRGRLLLRNDRARVLVLETERGTYRINYEDVADEAIDA